MFSFDHNNNTTLFGYKSECCCARGTRECTAEHNAKVMVTPLYLTTRTHTHTHIHIHTQNKCCKLSKELIGGFCERGLRGWFLRNCAWYAWCAVLWCWCRVVRGVATSCTQPTCRQLKQRGPLCLCSHHCKKNEVGLLVGVRQHFR